jgi:hypothetical protein
MDNRREEEAMERAETTFKAFPEMARGMGDKLSCMFCSDFGRLACPASKQPHLLRDLQPL